MSSTNKKAIGQRKKSSDEPVPNQSPESVPVVKDWSRGRNINENDKGNDSESNSEGDNQVQNQQHSRRASVLDFDRNDVAKLEEKKVSELNISDLLKVLIRRGEDQENITVRKECGVLLKKLNGERLRYNHYRPQQFQTTHPSQMHVQAPQPPSDEFVEVRHNAYRGGYRGGFRGGYRGGYRGNGNGYGNHMGFRENNNSTVLPTQ